MEKIDAFTLLDYFRGTGQTGLSSLGLTLSDLGRSNVTELAWGVSNIVLRVDAPDVSFVVKQSREQLRTEIDWFSGIERIWREVDVMRAIECWLPERAVPRVLFEDRENYLFAMEAVEADHRVWKAELLDGSFEADIAEQLAGFLAAIHCGSAASDSETSSLRSLMSDRTNFEELRLDPFYRHMARELTDMADPLTNLIEETWSRQDCLVLADFSPKNILLTRRGPVLVDFETGHFGDPGFDIGFFLSHLLLKTVKHDSRRDEIIQLPRCFWREYAAIAGEGMTAFWTSTFERRCVQHLAACMLSRVDGKSRVDYLIDGWQPDLVRDYCRELLLNSVDSIPDAFDRLLASLSRRP